MVRYRIYREHKYVSFKLSEFSRFVSKVDFSIKSNIEEVRQKFNGIKHLLHSHAEHEDTRIHELLRKIGSHVHQQLETDHFAHNQIFSALDQILTDAMTESNKSLKVDLGHKFYLGIQNLEGKNLLHQYQEETIIMSELQKHYSDEEILKSVDLPVYETMNVEEITGMLRELFPHFNNDDREMMLTDIYQAQAHNFEKIFPCIIPFLAEDERKYLLEKFNLSS